MTTSNLTSLATPRAAPLPTWPRVVTNGAPNGWPTGSLGLADAPLHLDEPARAGPPWAPAGYTSYVAWPRERTRLDLVNAARNASVVSRLLHVFIDHDESSFETLSGQDGLTFALANIAGDDACVAFFSEVRKRYKADFDAAFGKNGENLCDPGWTKENNGGGARHLGANDHGLVRFRWLREGLDHLLAARRLHGFQLAQFVNLTVRQGPLPVFRKQRFRLEASLAFIAAAMAASDEPPFEGPVPAKAPGADEERASVRKLIEQRLRRENETTKEAADALLHSGLDAMGGKRPAPGDLGVLGRRVLLLSRLFPFGSSKELTDLGTFTLDREQVFAGDPTTAVKAVAPLALVTAAQAAAVDPKYWPGDD